MSKTKKLFFPVWKKCPKKSFSIEILWFQSIYGHLLYSMSPTLSCLVMGLTAGSRTRVIIDKRGCMMGQKYWMLMLSCCHRFPSALHHFIIIHSRFGLCFPPCLFGSSCIPGLSYNVFAYKGVGFLLTRCIAIQKKKCCDILTRWFEKP